MTSEPNLWRVSSAESFTAPPIGHDKVVDLAVVGGGYTGCAAALEAARQGASVVLLEAQTVGHGGSGRNVGLVNAGLWLQPDAVMARIGQGPGRRLIDCLAEAPDRVFDLITREGIDCDPVRNGTLHLAHSRAGLRELQGRFRQGRALDAPLGLLDAAETTRRTGTGAFHGALFDPRAGTIQPLSYVRGLARAAIRNGAALHEQSPVTALKRDKDCWQLSARGHTIGARRVLVASNAYHLGLREPFQPQIIAVHFCQFATDPLPATLQQAILPGGEGCWDTALVMSSFRMDRAGRLIIGGIGNGDGPGGALHAGWAARKMAALFPALKGQPFRHGWSGRIAMTSDHIPKIVEFGPDAYAVFGYSGRGIGPGTVFGTQTARALLSGTADPLPVTPVPGHVERFSAMRAAWYEAGACMIHATAAQLR
ncbi:NAD(P)/FAD-dependent oxidoreductase [Roseinatronobacter alkalisoli]|uniref:FAD-binding oxidoreductase n=1 Tax=Roseinatronobacter alkalisoli TaxID=3028235 RepID=A0ABT5TE30_9RHOB|nr:FAD-binding oxidoreductase [Roseinatronobacter sp. HJB301]MDD7973359.1 FAD-binding oxidoreductase [Roseinatronobacter sp. HJB301]